MKEIGQTSVKRKMYVGVDGGGGGLRELKESVVERRYNNYNN